MSFIRRLPTAVALCALLQAVASGQTISTWTGAGSDNNWNTAANWSSGVPTSSGSTVLVFSGSTRTSPNNNFNDWNLSIGRLQFASGAASFTLGGNTFGFDPYLGSQAQQIFQNSANTQTIGVSAFSFRNGADSQINLNAGDLVISSPNMYIDATGGDTVRSLVVTGNDATRRTVTFAGNVNKGESGNDPDMYIRGNKRALVTGSLTFGSGNDASVFVEDGVLQFGGAGTMTGGRPAIGSASGTASAAVWLDTAGAAFAQQLELKNGSSGRRTIGGLNTSGTVTFSGDFAGGADTFDLAAATGGAAVFSGVRNFNGGLFVNRPEGATAYGGTVILSGTTNSDSFTAIHAGTLQFSDFNQLGSGHLEFNADSGDSGTLRYTGGSTTTTKTLWIDNPGITRAAIDVSQAGTTLRWNPGGTVNQNLTKTGAGWLFFGGGISGGTVGVEAGLMVLSASNSYSGGTVVSGGTLEVSAGGAEGGSPAALGTGTVSIASGAQVKYWLSLSGSNTVANPFSLSGGTLHTTDGFNTYSGRVTLASSASTISAQYEDTITLAGGLAGSGDVLFTQSGGTTDKAAPTFVLSGTGANTGTVRVSGSSGGGATKLQLANVNALQNATLDLAAGDTGTVEFIVAGNNTYNIGGLAGGRNLAFGSNALSVGGNVQSTTYSGTLSGSGGLTKVGSGQLALTGANTFTGPTSVAAGELTLNGSLAGGLGVLAGATISGTGTVGGDATIAGIHSPGNSPGIQTFTGNLTYEPGAVVEWELIDNTTGSAGTNYDQIILPSGNLTFSGSTTLALSFNSLGSTVNWADAFWDDDRAWMIYDLSGGTTTGLSNLSIGGSLLDSVGNSLSPTTRGYFTTIRAGQDVMLTFVAVPEPSTIAMTIVGLAGIAARGWQIRRRQQT